MLMRGINMLARSNPFPRRVRCRTFARNLTASLLCLAFAITLGACDPIVDKHAPVAVQLINSNFRVAVCASGQIAGVLVQTRGPLSFEDWATVWDADGEYVIGIGEILESADVPPGLVANVWNIPVVDAGDRVVIAIAGPVLHIGTEFTVPKGGIPSDRWLHPDGSTTSSPCEGVSN
jgi:hypothetical protein